MRFLAALVAMCCLGFTTGAAPSTSIVDPAVVRLQQDVVVHIPPVDAPVVDAFRMPEQPWLAGNRGLEYDTKPGQVIQASANGLVTFAGSVAGSKFVTIRHEPDLRTTVGFLDVILVSAGEVVSQGMPIAVAGERTHFSARRGDGYIDPALLFRRLRTIVRLVSDQGGP